MIAQWHDDGMGNAYLQVVGGIKAEVFETALGKFVVAVCGITMPPSNRYDTIEIAKAAAVLALRDHLQIALTKVQP